MKILNPAYARELYASSKGLMVNIHAYLCVCLCVCVCEHKENFRKMLFMCYNAAQQLNVKQSKGVLDFASTLTNKSFFRKTCPKVLF